MQKSKKLIFGDKPATPESQENPQIIEVWERKEGKREKNRETGRGWGRGWTGERAGGGSGCIFSELTWTS